MSNIDADFRRIVTDAAAAHGSVNRLCKAAGVPQASVSAWLAGAQASLSWSVVSRLCDHLRLTLVADKGKAATARSGKRPRVRKAAG